MCKIKKTGMFVGIGETKSPGWTCLVATRVTNIPFVLAFTDSLKKRGGEPNIGDMAIILYLSI